MSKCVAVIQHLPFCMVKFVLFHDSCLDFTAPCHNFFKYFWVPGHNMVNIIFKLFEQFRIRYNSIFHHFSQSRYKIPLWKCFQDIHIRNYNSWLMKGPHQVLSFWKIQPGLAAYCAVYLAQEGCGNLHKAYPPHECGSNKPCQVSDHPAAQSYDAGTSVKSVSGKFTVTNICPFQGLWGFRVRYFNNCAVKPCHPQVLQDTFTVNGIHCGIRYDGDFFPWQFIRNQGPHIVQYIISNVYMAIPAIGSQQYFFHQSTPLLKWPVVYPFLILRSSNGSFEIILL